MLSQLLPLRLFEPHMAGRRKFAWTFVPHQPVVPMGFSGRYCSHLDPFVQPLPGGVILNGNLKEILPVDLEAPDEIREFVPHSWYHYPDEGHGLHPWDGLTELDFRLGPNTRGSRTRIEALDENAKYSYIKAPRWKGHAVETGPLARCVIAYAHGREDFRTLIDGALQRLELPLPALFSTLGRTLARGLECQWAAERLVESVNSLVANLAAGDLDTANTGKWEPRTWPRSARGVGACEAPRGALGHWIRIEDERIANYQCVVPTTWNASPRDGTGAIGALEAALLGTPLALPEQPLELLRTIHSFDPCLACATHVISDDGNELAAVRVL